MIGRFGILIKKGQFNRIYTWVRILELVAIGLTIGITYSKLRDIIQGTIFSLKWILILMVSIGAIYALLVVKEYVYCLLANRQAIKIPTKINISQWKSNPESIKEKFDTNRIVVLMYLIIFCFSLFAGIAVFKNNQPLAIIPKLPSGTIGLRSYGCKVTFTKIEISFLDSNNIWQLIPSEITNNKSNWKKAFKTYGDTPGGLKYSNPNDTTLSITLNNSGVKFNTANPEVAKYFNGAQHFKVNTFITVASSYDKYADIQICMNVTTKSDNKESEELYLGLSLLVKDIYNSKIWIPALEWIAGSEYRYPISKLNDNGVFNDLKYGKEYNFMGVSFFNSARLLIKNTYGPSIICESKFESSTMIKEKKSDGKRNRKFRDTILYKKEWNPQ